MDEEYMTLKVTKDDKEVLEQLIQAAPSLLASIETTKQTNEMYHVFSDCKAALQVFIKIGNAAEWIIKKVLLIGGILGVSWLISKGAHHK